MKNAFAVSSLILTVGYFVALAAELIGAVSFRVPSFSTFMSVYVATSVLTLAFGDYFRQTGVRTNPRAPAGNTQRMRPLTASHVADELRAAREMRKR